MLIQLKKKVKDVFLFLKEYVKLSTSIKENNIYLFGVPFHSNMGDQAQTYCIKKWLHENYTGYQVHSFKLTTYHPLIIKYMLKRIKPTDLIVFHSGYHLTDLYSEQDVYCEIVTKFRNNKIIIFPQTINYVNEDNLLKTAAIFNNHGRITLLCRDEKSYATACQYFEKCNLLLYPDIVTSLIGAYTFKKERKGILFCIRNDKEGFYSRDQINELEEKFKANYRVEETDTTLRLSPKYIERNREKILSEIFEYYSKFQLIITDRYHGTIFSLISGTPVIVISSTDHKLSSGVKWFPKSFSPYVTYAKELDEVCKQAENILKIKDLNYTLPNYFKVNYFDKLYENINKFS